MCRVSIFLIVRFNFVKKSYSFFIVFDNNPDYNIALKNFIFE